MSDTDTLRITGAATGIHDACHGVGFRPACLERFCGLVLAKLPQFCDAEHLDIAIAAEVIEERLFRIAIVHDVLDGRCIREDFQYSGKKFGIREETYATGLIE